MTSNLFTDEMSDFLDMVRKLLDKGAKIYTRNKGGFTPLGLVKRGSDLEMFFFNYQDNSGSTLLHHAAFGNDPKLIKFLLNELKFNINIINEEGNTPLHVAARYGRLDAVKGLLSRRANIDARNNVNNTPLHIAARYGQLDVVRELLDKKAKIYTGNKAGNAPLHVAARYGQLDVVKELLDKKAKIYTGNKAGNAPLHVAARYGQLDVVKELLDKKVKINTENGIGSTPLHVAARYGQLDVVKELLTRRANIDDENKKGNTPLYVADINAKNNNNSTALHVAARYGHLNIVRELLDKKAKIYAKNTVGNTPLHVAARYGHLNIVREFLKRGAKTNAENKKSDTPLHVAARHDYLDVIKELLNKWAKINAKNSIGDTPLHVAARHGHLNIVRELLKRGANMYAENNDDLIPFELVNNESKLEVVNFLLDLKSDHGYTLMHYAVENNKTNLIGSLSRLWREDEINTYYDDIPLELTSGAKNTFSLINNLLNWIKSSIGRLLGSSSALPETSTNYSNTAGTSQFSREVCVSNNVGLAFFLLQSFLDKKYPLPKFCSITPEKALANTLNIVEEFEKALEKTARQSGVLVKAFDFFKVYSDIAGQVRNERYSQIPNILYLAAKEVCPKNEKFLSILKGNIEKMFDEQQVVDSGYQSNDIADNKPRSYLNNITVEKQLQIMLFLPEVV
ncbi:ankyrin repeat domain-containing protein [Wolbachia endosymbiont of Armadillidium arcangelii]|uniref:Ankyrin repeat domain-containing protein n=1 Tax=Wolbachia endosymbiont of Armadillidium arcangelii TaxID=3158571 RepID=A0AAU7Q2N8_9RICK